MRAAVGAVFVYTLLMAASLQPVYGYMHHEGGSRIEWRDYGDTPFREAEESGRPVFMLVTAVWCQWCREFEKVLQKEDVAGFINQNFIPVFLDYDRLGGVASKYATQGIPTVVVFTPEGQEVFRRVGYVDGEVLVKTLGELLTRIKEKAGSREAVPEREGEAVAHAARPSGTPQSLGKNFNLLLKARYDSAYGGFGYSGPKLPLPLLLNYLLEEYASTGDDMWLDMAEGTAEGILGDGVRGLFDPIDGGFWHYSEGRDWSRPHYEKITWKNAVLIKAYLRLYSISGRKEYRDAAESSLRFMLGHLRHPGGGFYGSMVADDEYYAAPSKARASRPPPPVDGVVYTRATSAAVLALLEASALRPSLLQEAEYSGEFMLQEMLGSRGAYRYHLPGEEKARLDGSLRANAWAALAFLELYRKTGKHPYLDGAVRCVNFALESLRHPHGGFISRNSSWRDAYRRGEGVSLLREQGPNGLMAYDLILLYEATGDKRYLSAAQGTVEAFYGEGLRIVVQDESPAYLAAAAELLREGNTGGVSLSGVDNGYPRYLRGGIILTSAMLVLYLVLKQVRRHEQKKR